MLSFHNWDNKANISEKLFYCSIFISNKAYP